MRGQSVLCLISDLFDGVPLETFIQQQAGRRLHPFMALNLLHHIARGLERIHAVGEYHGDVHSQNILVQQTGIYLNLRLLDFYDRGRPSKRLRRLDVLRAPAAATLGHTPLGSIEVAAGAEITAGNAWRWLLPGQREQVARMVDTMGGPGSEPRDTLEAMLDGIADLARPDYGDAVEVRDDSHLHAGHAGAREGRHFSVSVASPRFNGLSRVARHRLVYDALRSLIPQGIHALAIDARDSGDN